MLDQHTLPFPCRDVVSRQEPHGALLFQVRTDEMYFVSHSAFQVFALCDGTRTLGELEKLLTRVHPAYGSPNSQEGVEQLIESLAERQLIELWK